MKLSIIIVNYNVKYFLEQCLLSVQKAIKNIDAEVIVVDNASTDGSVPYLQERFSWVRLIASTTNSGFAVANNQGLCQCQGEFVLYLNPDTILAEDTLQLCLHFMEANKSAGGLGIRMVDGSGTFLPESKRSFPSPVTSFFKLVGLSKVFPKSKVFGKYALGYLDQHKNHEVDVLAGAFLMAPRDLLNKLNGFDETFFMYGEDIDLSYRIQKEGYKNYYFSESTIIHFKGESTKKGSLNYVRMFYQAMSIFVKKHYAGSKASFFQAFIQIAISVRAFMAAAMQFLVKVGLPLLDTIIIFGSFEMVNRLWIKYVRGGRGFIEDIVNVSLPGFTLVFLLAATVAGIYDNKYKPLKALYAAVVATVVMLAVYSLLPETLRFSRGVILFGGLTAVIFITLFRWLLLKKGLVQSDNESMKQNQTLIVGTEQEYEKVVELLAMAQLQERVMGRISADEPCANALGTVENLPALLTNLACKEVIFCEGVLSFKQIISRVQKLPSGVCVRFHADKSESIVGSDSKDTSGEIVAQEGKYAIADAYQQRMKRIVDVVFALFVILTFPLQMLLAGASIVKSALLVLADKRSWVGYSQPNQLPKILPGVLTTNGQPVNRKSVITMAGAAQIDSWYARHYDWTTDVKLILKNYRKLGQ